MATPRAEVYAAIDSEREYQLGLTRKGVATQMSQGIVTPPMAHLAIIRRIIRDMEDAYYDNAGPADMSFMRKIAAVAVRSMESHGAPHRA